MLHTTFTTIFQYIGCMLWQWPEYRRNVVTNVMMGITSTRGYLFLRVNYAWGRLSRMLQYDVCVARLLSTSWILLGIKRLHFCKVVERIHKLNAYRMIPSWHVPSRIKLFIPSAVNARPCPARSSVQQQCCIYTVVSILLLVPRIQMSLNCLRAYV